MLFRHRLPTSCKRRRIACDGIDRKTTPRYGTGLADCPVRRPRSTRPNLPFSDAGPPLEPQAQRTLAAWRAARGPPAVSRMLGAHTAAVKRQMTRPDQQK
jgi:hypothetical protein